MYKRQSTGTGIGIGIGIGIDKGIGIGIGIGIGKGKGIGIGTDKGIGIGMPKMLFLLCFLNEIVKSLKNLVFLRVRMADCDAGALRNPAQPGGGWLGAPRCQKC